MRQMASGVIYICTRLWWASSLHGKLETGWPKQVYALKRRVDRFGWNLKPQGDNFSCPPTMHMLRCHHAIATRISSTSPHCPTKNSSTLSHSFTVDRLATRPHKESGSIFRSFKGFGCSKIIAMGPEVDMEVLKKAAAAFPLPPG